MKKIIFSFIFVFVIGIYTGFNFSNPFSAEASVPFSDEYNAVVVNSSAASATVPFVVATSTRALGSVIVTTTGAQIIRIYDGIASTTAPQTATTTGTLIASFKANVGENTYTFDSVIRNGIIVDVPATFAGSYTVTHRR